MLFNLGSGKYRVKVLYQAKLELLRFQQGRLPTITYYEKYMQLVHAYERSGGTLGNDKGVLAYIDEWNADVRNLHPGDKPNSPKVTPTLRRVHDENFTDDSFDLEPFQEVVNDLSS